MEGLPEEKKILYQCDIKWFLQGQKFILNLLLMHQQGCQNTSTMKTSLLLVMLVAQLSD